MSKKAALGQNKKEKAPYSISLSSVFILAQNSILSPGGKLKHAAQNKKIRGRDENLTQKISADF